MDSDLWIARLAAAKRHYAAQLNNHSSSLSERIGMDEFELDDDDDEIRPEFACPYCYEDHDSISLCTHLEEEHPFESKSAVCPVCSEKINKDMLTHLTLQHGHLFFKTRRRLRRFVIPSNQAISLLSRDLRDSHLQALLNGSGNNIRSNNNNNNNNSSINDSKNNIPINIASDPLLSSLVLNFSPSIENEQVSKSSLNEICQNKEILPKQKWKSSYDASLTFEEREQKKKQAAEKAKFVQNLILSTLLIE